MADSPRLPDDGRPEMDAQLADTQPPADIKPPADTQAPTDTQPPLVPIAAVELAETWSSLTAPCLDQSGNTVGPDISLLDGTSVRLFSGSTTLNSAPSNSGTVAWAGGLPSVTVLFDPNACGQEDPISKDNEWSSAGLLIRGATIDGQGRLQLEPGTTVQDIDFLDVTSNGTFEGGSDFAQPDDALLPDYPQLYATISVAKQALIELAQP